ARSLEAATAVSPPAADARPAGQGLTLTKTGAIVGTPAYMAPEQLSGEPVDARSDLFSYCSALYEALFGRHPFPLESLDALQQALARGAVRQPLPGRRAPRWLHRVLLRGLERDPARRPASMAALLGDLSRGLGRRRRQVAVAVAVALAGLAVWLGVREGGPS